MKIRKVKFRKINPGKKHCIAGTTEIGVVLRKHFT